jgi:sulfate transport system ATP-binding protein
MTVFENVAFGLRVKPRRERPSEAAIREKVRELLARVQLDTLAHRYPAELSGGQRQRIALARALAVDPKVLLLDEPFGALDAKVRKELRAWLRRLHDELAISTLFVTHDQEEALDVADRIVVMNHGRVEQTGTPQAVYDAPATPFVYSFLGATNRFEGRIAPQGFVIDGPGQRALPDAVAPDARGLGAAYAYARPHELALHRRGAEPAGGIRADVRRVIVRGASVRVELSGASGPIEAEMDRDAWQALALAEGDGVTVVPRALRVFDAP